MPRRRGRGGGVTATGRECPASTSFSRVGTANRGVPQKTRLRGVGIWRQLKVTNVQIAKLPNPPPLSRLHQFLDLALDEVALERADVRDVELAVQVIGLVQEGARQQLFSGVLEKLSAQILRAYRNGLGARDLLAKFGNAQAAFAAPLAALFANDYRIDQNQLGARVFLEGHIDDGDSLRNADLRSCQANAASRVHRLEHVIHKLLDLVVEAGHHGRRFFQNRIAKFHNCVNHLRVPNFSELVSV